MPCLARTLFLSAILLAAPAAFGEPAGAEPVEFELFDSMAPIGDGAVDPRPGTGETLLLQFWASWCQSCGSLMWDMDEIVSRGDDVKYLAISLDDEASAAASYIRKHPLFAKYADRYFFDEGKTLAASLGIETVPSILLVASNGEVKLRKSGHLNSTDLGDIVAVIRQPDQ